MKGAIFDVDGTILDSMMAWADVTGRFFKNHGLTLTNEKAASYKDQTLEKSLSQINSEFNLQMTSEDMLNEFTAMIGEEYEKRIKAKPDVDKYLKKLHDGGVKIAVATSGYKGLCAMAFARLGILQYIDAYAFSSEVGCNKSKPDVYLLAAERIGVRVQDCVVFEDIVTGVKTAKAAGFKTCAIYDKTNAHETDALKKYADRYINGWAELLG